jgi:hypothetical protein
MTSNDEDPQILTAGQPHPPVVSDSVDGFDRELGKWFSLHGGVWSGTAAELLAALKHGVDAGRDWWPQSTRALHGHIESHRQNLRALGLAVLQSSGYPRMISIRACQDEQPGRDFPSSVPPINETVSPESPAERPDPSALNTEGVCDNTAETLLAMLRTSAADEPTTPSTMSKLAAAPAHLRTAFRRAWTRGPRAM